MRNRVSPNWMNKKEVEIENGTFESVITSHNPAAQWLVVYLANRDIPAKVTSLGAGVKRITLEENICPTCKGKGYVKKEDKHGI